MKDVAVLGATAWLIALGACTNKEAAPAPAVSSPRNGGEQEVISELQKQYDIVSRNGSAQDKCLQAGMLAAAYLQASNEAGFKQWKAQENEDCKAAEQQQ